MSKDERRVTMDIDAIPSSGLDRTRLVELSKRGNGRGGLHLALHMGAIGLAAALTYFARGSPFLWPAMLVLGVLLIFLFAPLHETIHRTAFASRGLNDGVAFVLGALLVLPPEYFRAFHFAHHRFTQDPARDPELATAKPSTAAAYLLHVSGLPYWWSGIRTTLTHALTARVAEPFVSEARRPATVAEARLLWAIYTAVIVVSVALPTDVALVYWVGPALLGQPFLRLYLLAEHWGCPESPNMLENTRTTLTNAAVRWLAWNMPYHGEHHACPSVPFHGLPALHAMIGGRVRVTAPGYAALHRSYIRTLYSRAASVRRGDPT